MAYITTCLYEVKVINGTSNAMGEAEDNVRLHRQSVLTLFMTTKPLLV